MRRGAMIRIDVASSGIVIACDGCPHWWGFRFDVIAAWRCAADHEERCHPESTRARKWLHHAMTRR